MHITRKADKEGTASFFKELPKYINCPENAMHVVVLERLGSVSSWHFAPSEYEPKFSDYLIVPRIVVDGWILSYE